MKAVFGGLLLAAVLAAAEAKADPGPDPAPARTSASTATSRFHPAQLWGGIGYYNTSVSVCFFGRASLRRIFDTFDRGAEIITEPAVRR